MSKILPYILIVAVVAGLARLFLPWWSGIVVAGAVGLSVNFKQKRHAFLSGLCGMILRSQFILSPQIAAIFSFPAGTVGSWLLTTLVAGISGGLGALTGNLLRRIFIKPKRDYFY